MDGMQSPAAIGHNNPPAPDLAQMLDPDILRDQIALDHVAIFARRDELLASCERYHDKFPDGPKTEAESGQAGDFIAKQLKPFAKQAETLHGEVKRPFLGAGRLVDAMLKAETSERILSASKLIESKVTTYLRRKADDERKAAQDEANRKAAEAAKLAAAAAAEQNAQRAEDLMERAVEVAEQADTAAARTQATAADLSRTRGAFGSVASLRDNWGYEVADLMQLIRAVAEGREPVSYLTVNDAVVRGVIKPKDGVRAIAGLTITNNQTAGFR